MGSEKGAGTVDQSYRSSMKPRTELFLYHLLWHLDQLSRPSFRNLTDSFEAWAFRNRLHSHIRRLERRGLVERGSGLGSQVYRLSEAGRRAALGGRDPDAAWDRPWDGVWRVLMFDVPIAHGAARSRLRRRLKAAGFGFLQNSVWISPDPIPADLRQLTQDADGVEFLTELSARTAGKETDLELVRASWCFGELDRRHEHCLEILANLPRPRSVSGDFRKALLDWGKAEHQAWQAVVDLDPFLPGSLLPAGYRGREVWRRRMQVLAEAGSMVRDLRADPIPV
jgi:phenylacetic acid degradation operon negative regulatory protein